MSTYLREQVSRQQAFNLESSIPDQYTNIPRLRMDIAADVDDSCGSETHKLRKKQIITAFPRRIDQDCGLRRWVLDFLRDICMSTSFR